MTQRRLNREFVSMVNHRRHALLATVRTAVALWLGCLGAACGDDPAMMASYVTPLYPNSCVDFACSGQGTCVQEDPLSAPHCICEAGFAGEHCAAGARGFHADAQSRCVPDKRCADAEENPCGSFGDCHDENGVIECTCTPGYAGPRCDLCAPGYAQHDSGECLQKILANGQLATVALACDANACHGHGQCQLIDKQQQCDCDLGYDGAHCEACADGYAQRAGSNRCLSTATCEADGCGICSGFDGEHGFPNHPDTCLSMNALQLAGMSLSSLGGDGAVWLCAPSTLYGLKTEHVALEAGAHNPAEIVFDAAIASISFDYAAWQTLSVDVLVDGMQLETLTAARHAGGASAHSFAQPIHKLGFRSTNDYAQTLALDNIVYQPALCQ